MQITNIPFTSDDLSITISAMEEKVASLGRAKPSPLNAKLKAKAEGWLSELRSYAAPAAPAQAPAPAAKKPAKSAEKATT